MTHLLNLIYLLVLLLAAPWLLYKSATTGKYRQGMLDKFLGRTPRRTGQKPCAWFHAVSVGEVLLLRQVIAGFRRRHPDWECIVSTTTNTGHAVAQKVYPDLMVCYYPLDFSWAVKRALASLRPSLVVLAELELWPNFIRLAKKRGCPVALVNGRMSPRSHRGYARIRWFMAGLLGRIDLLAVQNEEYGRRLLSLGADGGKIQVTGSVKFDGVVARRDHPRTLELARLLGIGSTEELIWVVGSTQAPEEQIVLDIHRRARERFPGLRLILAPRHQERFEEVAGLVEKSGLPFARRSRIAGRLEQRPPVILLDSLGELSAIWGLADLAYVGGSLSRRGGQNMIEPGGCGVAVLFGPHVWNFQDTADRLIERQAAVQVQDASELEREVHRLLADPAARRRLGQAAQEFVSSQQGAAERTLDLLDRVIVQSDQKARAA